MQKGTDSIKHPICYYSCKFDCHQQNYSTSEKEALALVSALQHFSVYLNSMPFHIVVYTDHNPLTFINRMKNKNQWLLLGVCYYKSTIWKSIRKVNVKADALSHILTKHMLYAFLSSNFILYQVHVCKPIILWRGVSCKLKFVVFRELNYCHASVSALW